MFPAKSVIFPWVSYVTVKKIKLDEVELRSSSFDRFPFYYASIFTVLQPLGSGYHEIKVNELPDWEWARCDGTKAANWGSLKGYLCECFFFLPPYILHVSTHFEKSRRLRILWTIWNFSMISAEKVPGSFDFCHHRGVDFASEAPRTK